jgi:hypothetical protein
MRALRSDHELNSLGSNPGLRPPEKQHEQPPLSDWLIYSRGGTRTRDPGIMSENATPWERETSAVTAQIETFFVNSTEEEAKKFEVKGCLGRKRARTVLRAGQRAYRRRRSKEAAAYERAGARFDGTAVCRRVAGLPPTALGGCCHGHRNGRCLTCFGLDPSRETTRGLMFWSIAWVVLIALIAWWLSWLCPRCEHYFFPIWYHFGRYGRDRCDNCGLPKWSMRDPDSDAPPTCG